MRVILFLVAMAAIVSICQGAGPCTASVSKVCAFCQDVNSRCAVCKPGYQCLGTKASNCYSSANAAYACPAAAKNCLSCSPPCPGAGNLKSAVSAACLLNWNVQYGCAVCLKGYRGSFSLVPILGNPPNTPACRFVNVTTCVPPHSQKAKLNH